MPSARNTSKRFAGSSTASRSASAAISRLKTCWPSKTTFQLPSSPDSMPCIACERSDGGRLLDHRSRGSLTWESAEIRPIPEMSDPGCEGESRTVMGRPFSEAAETLLGLECTVMGLAGTSVRLHLHPPIVAAEVGGDLLEMPFEEGDGALDVLREHRRDDLVVGRRHRGPGLRPSRAPTSGHAADPTSPRRGRSSWG